MEMYQTEIVSSVEQNQGKLWKFVRIAEGIWIATVVKNLFHDSIYSGALLQTLDTKYSSAIPADLEKATQEYIKRSSEKPLDAGYILLCNNTLYVCEGSVGFNILEDNPERPNTIAQIKENLPGLQILDEMDDVVEAVFDRLDIA